MTCTTWISCLTVLWSHSGDCDSIDTCSHYKCAVQKPWWSLHQLLIPSQSMTTEACRGQDQEHSCLPTHSYAMEEDIDVTSRTEVILFHLWSFKFLISFQCLGLQQPNTIKTERLHLFVGQQNGSTVGAPWGFPSFSTLLYNIKQLRGHLFKQFCHTRLTSPKINTSPSALAVISGLARLAWWQLTGRFPYPHLGFLAATLLLAPWPLAMCIASFVNSWINLSPAWMGAGQGQLSSKEMHP